MDTDSIVEGRTHVEETLLLLIVNPPLASPLAPFLPSFHLSLYNIKGLLSRNKGTRVVIELGIDSTEL